MKTSTKWILGIIITLLVIAVIVTVSYLAINRGHYAGWMMDERAFQPWEKGRELQPWNNKHGAPWRNMPMHPNFRMPGRRIGGFLGFPIISVITRCAIPVVILFALVYLIFSMRRPAQTAPIQTPYQAAVPAPSQPTHPCSNCGRKVQEDWSHCPYCGNELTTS